MLNRFVQRSPPKVKSLREDVINQIRRRKRNLKNLTGARVGMTNRIRRKIETNQLKKKRNQTEARKEIINQKSRTGVKSMINLTRKETKISHQNREIDQKRSKKKRRRNQEMIKRIKKRGILQ